MLKHSTIKVKEVPWFVTELTYDEIEDVYAEAGVTYDSIVGETQRHFDKKVSKSAEIVKPLRIWNNIRRVLTSS